MATTIEPTAPRRKPHTPEQEEKYYRMSEQEKKYIAVDPKTKEPMPEAKDFFWKILAAIPACDGANEFEVRINFQIQKYWRNKTYKAQIAPDNSNTREVHEPWFELYPDGDRLGRAGQLRTTGERILDADDFIAGFKLDAE